MIEPISQRVLVANIIFPILAVVAVGLRVIARRYQVVGFAIDDYLIFVSLAIALGECVAGVYAASINLFDVDYLEVYLPEVQKRSLMIWIDAVLSYLVYTLIRLSILFMYKRIFVKKSFNRVINVWIGVVLAFFIAAECTHIFQEFPVNKFWIDPLADADINYGACLLAFAGLDIVLDLVTWSLPLFVISSLQMSKAKKYSVAGVFGLGFFCVVASAIRLYYTYQYTFTDVKVAPMEALRIFTENDIWAHAEACLSIVAACVPTLGPLFRGGRWIKWLPRSVRAFFSVRSPSPAGQLQGELQQLGSSESLASKKVYDNVKPGSECVTTYIGRNSNVDVESQLMQPERIYVKQSVKTTVG